VQNYIQFLVQKDKDVEIARHKVTNDVE